MLTYTGTTLAHLSAHKIGNKTNDEDLVASRSELDLADDDLRDQLLSYFLRSFTSEEFYNFSSTDDDFRLNPLFQFATDIFESTKKFHTKSVSIAKHLYEVSLHPQIKSGDLFVVYFSNLEVGEEKTDAVGIFKSESKSSFLKLTEKKDGNFAIDCENGISLEKLDKACLIYNLDAENGFKISIIDRSSKSTEAQYWKELFLRVKPIESNFQSTRNFLDIAKHYVTDQITEEFELSKADQITYLNKSITESHGRRCQMKYVVKRYWELCDSVEVTADSPSQAIELAHAMPVDNARAAFVPDSMNTDPESEVWLVATGGDS